MLIAHTWGIKVSLAEVIPIIGELQKTLMNLKLEKYNMIENNIYLKRIFNLINLVN